MPNINKITLPNGVTYDIVDPVARESAAAGFSLVVVSELPTASAETKGSIYLVAHSHEDSDDTYDEYVTVESGTTTKTYSWEKIGNTDVDLSTTTDTFVKTISTTSQKLVTTSIPNVTGNSSVTATNTVFGTNTKASKATAGTAVSVAKVGTAKSIPNVTSAGSASTWSFSVANETLTISGGNGSAPTLGTAISVTPAESNGTITPYTFTDVTVPVVSSNAEVTATNTTLGTAITAATGTTSTSGTGSSVITSTSVGSTGSAVTKIGK